jgi:hypothetical protein
VVRPLEEMQKNSCEKERKKYDQTEIVSQSSEEVVKTKAKNIATRSNQASVEQKQANIVNFKPGEDFYLVRRDKSSGDKFTFCFRNVDGSMIIFSDDYGLKIETYGSKERRDRVLARKIEAWGEQKVGSKRKS